MQQSITRRMALSLIAAVAAVSHARAGAKPRMVVHKDPSCGCCEAWVDHVRGAGYPAESVETDAINAVKAKLGVPVGLRSCHTAEIDVYVLEGHVPASAIDRLLAERPRIRGLAVPGMPIGSPGMEVEGREPETYDIMAFGDAEPRAFMRFRGGMAA